MNKCTLTSYGPKEISTYRHYAPETLNYEVIDELCETIGEKKQSGLHVISWAEHDSMQSAKSFIPYIFRNYSPCTNRSRSIHIPNDLRVPSVVHTVSASSTPCSLLDLFNILFLPEHTLHDSM